MSFSPPEPPWLLIGLAIAIFIVFAWFYLADAHACRQAGGVLVRAPIWYTCVDPKEAP